MGNCHKAESLWSCSVSPINWEWTSPLPKLILRHSLVRSDCECSPLESCLKAEVPPALLFDASLTLSPPPPQIWTTRYPGSCGKGSAYFCSTGFWPWGSRRRARMPWLWRGHKARLPGEPAAGGRKQKEIGKRWVKDSPPLLSPQNAHTHICTHTYAHRHANKHTHTTSANSTAVFSGIIRSWQSGGEARAVQRAPPPPPRSSANLRRWRGRGGERRRQVRGCPPRRRDIAEPRGGGWHLSRGLLPTAGRLLPSAQPGSGSGPRRRRRGLRHVHAPPGCPAGARLWEAPPPAASRRTLAGHAVLQGQGLTGLPAPTLLLPPLQPWEFPQALLPRVELAGSLTAEYRDWIEEAVPYWVYPDPFCLAFVWRGWEMTLLAYWKSFARIPAGCRL